MVNAIQVAQITKQAGSPSAAPVVSSGESEKFKQLLNQAISESAELNAQRVTGIVEEVTPEMASQFFAQIVPEDEFNPRIERFESRGQGVTPPMPVDQDTTGVRFESPNRISADERSASFGINGIDDGLTYAQAPAANRPKPPAGAPFQIFIDKAVDFFLRVSDLERKSDVTMVDYAQGRASLEQVMIEKAKVSVALSFSVTLINQVTQSFKEIQNMQV